MKAFCLDCKNMAVSFGERLCDRLVSDPVTGGKKPLHKKCKLERRDGAGRCGVKGTYFREE